MQSCRACFFAWSRLPALREIERCRESVALKHLALAALARAFGAMAEAAAARRAQALAAVYHWADAKARLALTHWVLYVADQRRLRRTFTLVLLRRAELVQRSHLRHWGVACKTAAQRRSQVAALDGRRDEKLLAAALGAWAALPVQASLMRRKHAAATLLADTGRKGRALDAWDLARSILRRERLQHEQAGRHAAGTALGRAFRAWQVVLVIQRLHAFAYQLGRLRTMHRVMDRWVAATFVLRAEREEKLALVAAQHVTRTTFGRAFFGWRFASDWRVVMRERSELADQMALFGLARRHFFKWQLRVALRAVKQRKLDAAMSLMARHLAANAWVHWGALVASQNQKRRQLHTAVRHHHTSVTRNVVRCWLLYMAILDDKYDMLRRALAQRHLWLLRRHWTEWCAFMVIAAERQWLHSVATEHWSSSAQAQAMEAWRLGTAIAAEERRVAIEARAHAELASLRDGLRDWKHWVSQRHAEQRAEDGRVSEVRGALDASKVQRAFGGWFERHQHCLAKGYALETASRHANRASLTKTYDSWLDFVGLRREKHHHTAEAVAAHQRTQRVWVFTAWQDRVGGWQTERAAEEASDSHCRQGMLQAGFAAFREARDESRRLAAEEEEALALYRHWILSDACRAWLRSAADARSERTESAIRESAARSARVMRVVERCARHWRARALLSRRADDYGHAIHAPRPTAPRNSRSAAREFSFDIEAARSTLPPVFHAQSSVTAAAVGLDCVHAGSGRQNASRAAASRPERPMPRRGALNAIMDEMSLPPSTVEPPPQREQKRRAAPPPPLQEEAAPPMQSVQAAPAVGEWLSAHMQSEFLALQRHNDELQAKHQSELAQLRSEIAEIKASASVWGGSEIDHCEDHAAPAMPERQAQGQMQGRGGHEALAHKRLGQAKELLRETSEPVVPPIPLPVVHRLSGSGVAIGSPAMAITPREVSAIEGALRDFQALKVQRDQLREQVEELAAASAHDPEDSHLPARLSAATVRLGSIEQRYRLEMPRIRRIESRLRNR